MGFIAGLFAKPDGAPSAAEPQFDALDAPLRLRDALAGTGRRAAPSGAGPSFKLPLIGRLTLQKQLSVLSALLALSLIVSLLLLVANTRDSSVLSAQTQLASNALMHSQRIGKAAPNAVAGSLDAFRQLRESHAQLNLDLNLMEHGGTYVGRELAAPRPSLGLIVADARKNWRGTDQAADTILALKSELTGLRKTLQDLNAMTPVLLAQCEEIATLTTQQGGTLRDMAVLGRMMMLAERISASASELLAPAGISPEAALLLVRDPVYFRAALDGFLNGSSALQLRAIRAPQWREHVIALGGGFEAYDKLLASIVDKLPQFKAAKSAERLIFSDNEELRQRLGFLLQAYRNDQDALGAKFWWMVGAGLLTLIAAAGMGRVLLEDSRNRTRGAERRRLQADAERTLSQQQERQAKASNDQIQAAILRLMNELQKVADGDLTVQATVSADITGAIADSINYTVEELRGLVGRVTATAGQVSQASSDAQERSHALLTAAQRQSGEIEEASASVVKMAREISAVATSANESAEVARQSVAAAQRGAAAVENAIVGMHEIREQIQETSKRIKRLGESSQEIGEITELISDITEQTNVLALNAAIQAASAGAAGRGFSVVAEEVQRLAERSAAAARQIGALVRTIQTDTRDAATAMDKSTRGVVEGARLSDAAGAALSDIGAVSQRLAELIQAISFAAGLQATAASAVALDIGHILVVTEQTQGGTQQTAESIHRLSLLAQELKNSVARFRVLA